MSGEGLRPEPESTGWSAESLLSLLSRFDGRRLSGSAILAASDVVSADLRRRRAHLRAADFIMLGIFVSAGTPYPHAARTAAQSEQRPGERMNAQQRVSKPPRDGIQWGARGHRRGVSRRDGTGIAARPRELSHRTAGDDCVCWVAGWMDGVHEALGWCCTLRAASLSIA